MEFLASARAKAAAPILPNSFCAMSRKVSEVFTSSASAEPSRAQTEADAVEAHGERVQRGVDRQRLAKGDAAVDAQIVLGDVERAHRRVRLERLAQRLAAARAGPQRTSVSSVIDAFAQAAIAAPPSGATSLRLMSSDCSEALWPSASPSATPPERPTPFRSMLRR